MKINNRYIPTKFISNLLRELKKETKKDDSKELKNAKCEICGRSKGDFYTLKITIKLNTIIQFRVKIRKHMFYDNNGNCKKINICDGCHLDYHLNV